MSIPRFGIVENYLHYKNGPDSIRSGKWTLHDLHEVLWMKRYKYGIHAASIEKYVRPKFPNDLPAETRFKAAVHGLISMGIYPAPSAIRKVLGQPYSHVYNAKPTLNGRELKWRKEVCREREFKLKEYGNPMFDYESYYDRSYF